MALVGPLEHLEWSQLKVRAGEPRAVLASIPADGLHTFLRLLAVHPLEPFFDASVMLLILRELKDTQSLEFLESYRAAGGKDGAADVRAKRGFREDGSTPAFDADLAAEDARLSQDGAPKKRARRSGRAPGMSRRPLTSGSDDLLASTWLTAGETSDSVKIGSDHQADVPQKPSFTSRASMPPEQEFVKAQLVYSADKVGGDIRVSQFIQLVNESLLRRDGFTMSPMCEETALQAMMSNPANLERARRIALLNITQGVRYPGAGAKWTSEEQCLLARAFSEHNRDFEYISRHVLVHRTTKELVVHYYTRYKQQWPQHGDRKDGSMLDRGMEAPPRIVMSPETVVDFVRYLAATAGDGFPPERRMRDALLAARAKMIDAAASIRERERKRKLSEAATGASES